MPRLDRNPSNVTYAGNAEGVSIHIPNYFPTSLIRGEDQIFAKARNRSLMIESYLTRWPERFVATLTVYKIRGKLYKFYWPSQEEFENADSVKEIRKW